jgi:uncharacterized protein with HEPN domain
MPRHDPQVRLQHMLEYAREAIGLMRDKKRADLDTDRTLGLATLRCLEIVGTRNRLVHGYDLVDYDIIWSTVTEDLPPLIAELEKIL